MIDDKLREILANVHVDSDWAISKIKQAFADEGYVNFKAEYQAKGFMTGQEWYKRFVAEYNIDGDANNYDGVLDCAKRASGIDV